MYTQTAFIGKLSHKLQNDNIDLITSFVCGYSYTTLHGRADPLRAQVKPMVKAF
ncbi:hypothetical protein SYNTR_0329 [Candidatus Syntrophocurvum alkaliphilum]|uniref:Uncharacterized protein n=1 Tax=Candidatus Syntrophocurvum alkaliphilum TaxID=2293317 RepID=A0A6I6DDP1_9FIRM|nr:hypothetical protein SYNTR_0329 [Candidatus Syntrophocurvum alkaliphilum]